MPTHLQLTQRLRVQDAADDLAEAFESLAFDAKGEGRERQAELLKQAACHLRDFADAYDQAMA